MGANLVPILRNFSIKNAPGNSTDITESMKDGCVTAGDHRLLRFDMRTYNKGNADFNMGKPIEHPEIFEWSAAHGHWHNKHFNEYTLFNMLGQAVVPGFKQGFCLEDIERIDPNASPTPKFHCDAEGRVDQGVQPGWADVYSVGLPCQFIVIDGVQDGYYRLLATTNARFVAHEDDYTDNTIIVGLHLHGDTVIQLTEQDNWRWCHKCQGLAFAGNPSPGACPAGGLHDHAGSGNYSLVQYS